MAANIIKSDITIIGGGLVGLTLAAALAPLGMRITILEAEDPKTMQSNKFDGRVSAIAYGSRLIFEQTGTWRQMAEEAGEILDIRIVDGDSPLFLHYDHALVGEQPMGHIVENRFIRRSLFAKLAEYENVSLLAPMRYKTVKYTKEKAEIELADGRHISCRLLVAADGRNSHLRSLAAIKTYEWDYGQNAIVCTIKHEKHHNGVALERFLPAGPFAVLPMGGGHHSSLVWTEKSAAAPHFLAMEEAEFNREITSRTGDYLGKTEALPGKWSYPLALVAAQQYHKNRLCLVGDAAHGIHPVAGQGFNLGIRDVAALAELITETHQLGLDIGGKIMLAKYESRRKFDNAMMIAATDGLNRLFSNNIMPVKLARDMGLAAVNKMPIFKKAFMKHAMGGLRTDDG